MRWFHPVIYSCTSYLDYLSNHLFYVHIWAADKCTGLIFWVKTCLQWDAPDTCLKDSTYVPVTLCTSEHILQIICINVFCIWLSLLTLFTGFSTGHLRGPLCSMLFRWDSNLTFGCKLNVLIVHIWMKSMLDLKILPCFCFALWAARDLKLLKYYSWKTASIK